MSEQNKKLICTEASIEELKYAIQNRIPIHGLKGGITHPSPHLDEVASDLILKETPEGEYLFPGYKETPLCLQTERQLLQNDLLGELGFYRALQNGYLIFGTGGGTFDEHKDRFNKRTSCFQKIVRYLDLTNDKFGKNYYANIINYIRIEDRNGALVKLLPVENSKVVLNGDYRVDGKRICDALSRFGEISSVLKKGMIAHEDNLHMQGQLVIAIQILLSGEIAHQKLYLEEKKRSAKVSYQKIGEANVALIEDATKFSAGNLRNSGGQKVDIIVSINEKKQLALFREKKGIVTPEQMREVSKILKVLAARKFNEPVPDWNQLSQDSDPNHLLFFHAEAGSIYNGSNTQYDTPGIMQKGLVSLNDLKNALEWGVGSEYHPSFAENCKKGSCARSKCPMYVFGLNRCHDVRTNK